MARVAARDSLAARQLYRAHADRVFRAVARVMGRWHPDVEDVVQQVFVTAFLRPETFEGRSRLSTWLVGIAARRAVDAVRASERRRRWAKLKRRFGMESEGAVDQRAHVRAEAERYLDLLRVEQRAVFVLCEVEGYTLKEVSEMTAVSVSTLHSRLKAARRRLDEALSDERGEEGAS
ncbi:MAG: RNA polymerase sigma factor [Myxococcales bacterium]|nr:RNA polymerase sigma factor [Myxococcales bacterium]